LARLQPQLKVLGYALVILVPDSMERTQKIAKLLRGEFPVLADPDRRAFRAFGFGRKLLFIQQSGIVVVDREGALAYQRRSTAPRGAFDPAELMKAVGTESPP
jgi:peroxiredoxin